jgi:hypothetical protein
MNTHLQRLLARVAPPFGGSVFAAQPVNPIASPLAESDQRIGLPEFSGLALPVGSMPAQDEPETGPVSMADHVAPRPQVREPLVNTVEAPEIAAPQLPRSEPPHQSSPLAWTEPAVVETPWQPAPQNQPSDAAAPPRTPDPAEPAWRPSFEIAPEDLRPIPVQTVDTAPEEPASAMTTPDRSSPTQTREAEPAPAQHAEAEAQPVFEARPVRPAVALVAPETVSLDEPVPASAKPAPAAEPAEPQALEIEEPSGARPVVIEELVIDVAPPPTARGAPAPAVRSEPGAQRSAPLSAEAASVIGPLPLSRRQPTILGMRRR